MLWVTSLSSSIGVDFIRKKPVAFCVKMEKWVYHRPVAVIVLVVDLPPSSVRADVGQRRLFRAIIAEV
ncbi:hypothetical protein PsorP6_011388 [Peronosclerospora sorghi]|uniref:Uncharacterized protein n=1 Tax=Peronosclerospora sorghi TaxID=230839 RepID=A0ACC0WJS8_9STRA|nr:hypothetical protein PsorP6_011388 [Peronosclerospora sorghi]